jgi:predicted acylesterase/phospholipase RssA
MNSPNAKLAATTAVLALVFFVPRPARGGSDATRERAERIRNQVDELESFLPGDARSRDAIESVRRGAEDDKSVGEAERAKARADSRIQSAPAVVVSGGISLGAYQAGFISALVRYWSVVARDAAARGEKADPLPRVWTGASAGAVNALLGGLASCDPAFRAERWSPEETLFWSIWIERLDLAQLLPETYPRRDDHLFSTSYMEQSIAAIRAAAEGPTFRAGCSFAYGVTATNLKGRDIPLDAGQRPAQLKRVTEKLVVQVSTDPHGSLRARLPTVEGTPHATLPFVEVNGNDFRYYSALGGAPSPGGGDPVPLGTVFQTPQASGAFPVAFEPVDVAVSLREGDAWQPPKTLSFVDGGFLNNNPLDLAARLGSRWHEDEGKGFDRKEFPVVYLDQDIVEWSWKKAPEPKKPPGPLQKTYLRHMPTLFAAARDSVILDALENDPALFGRVKVPRRTAVLPSEFRFAMMGFVDRRFREHDFYRGMLDAVRFLGRELAATSAVRRRSEAEIRAALAISSPAFACVADGACSGSDLAQLGKLRVASQHLTRTANGGGLEEDDLDSFLRALKDQGYVFSAGVLPATAATGTRADLRPLRARVGNALLELIAKQETAQRVALRPAGTAFLDEWLTYSPPERVLVLGLSRSHGFTVGGELPFAASERRDREERAYDRSEWRAGSSLGAFGRRHFDQLDPDDTRWRWVTAGASLDYVSDFDGFLGKWGWLKLGPYVRWRAGVGLYGSFLSSPREWSVTPELRLGIDIVESVGVRVTGPVAVARDRQREGGDLRWSKFSEIGVAVEVLVTRW